MSQLIAAAGEVDAVGLGTGSAEHDVEVSTFSSQVVGQALAEAARSISEGNSLLRSAPG